MALAFYLAMFSGRIGILFVLLTIACLVITVVQVCTSLSQQEKADKKEAINTSDSADEREERSRAFIKHDNASKKAWRKSKIYASMAGLFLVLSILTPSTNTAYLLVGGHYAEKIATGEVGTKVQDLLIKRLDDAISEMSPAPVDPRQ